MAAVSDADATAAPPQEVSARAGTADVPTTDGGHTGQDQPPPHTGHLAAVGSSGDDGGRDGGGRGGGGRRRRRGGGGRGERTVVPDATFSSYYGRPILKPVAWEADIPAYYALGGLAGASSLLAAGAAATGRARLRRVSRTGALVGITGSLGFLVHDLGRPERFYMMLRSARVTSPMSMGTWLLAVYGPAAGLAAVGGELVPALAVTPGRLGALARGPLGRLAHAAAAPAGGVAAVTGPGVAAYTAVLTADTAVPSWHDVGRDLPFVFVGSAAAAGGGLGLLAAPHAETGPARRLAVGGAVLDLAADAVMRRRAGLSAEPYEQGRAAAYSRAARALTVAGAAGAVIGARSRLVSAAAGAALMAGSWCTRFAVFHAGVQSAEDPKYTVVPQRERLAARERAAEAAGPHAAERDATERDATAARVARDPTSRGATVS